jgi:hypothetical protein
MDSNHCVEPCGLLPYRLGYAAPRSWLRLGRACPHVPVRWAPSATAPSPTGQHITGDSPANLDLTRLDYNVFTSLNTRGCAPVTIWG